MMRTLVLLPACVSACLAIAQVQLNKPVVLEGANASERSVQGLPAPTAEEDALSASALAAGAYQYAEVSGDQWQATLLPGGAQPVTGMRLLLHCATTNAGAVTLSVNGSAPQPVVKDGNAPLVAGDVPAGATVSVVHDGNAFQLISARRIERKPCPAGTTQVTELFCITTAQQDSSYFPEAANTCGALGMKVCSWAQFYTACTRSAQLGLTDMTNDWEWADDGANADTSVRTVGAGTCTIAGVGLGWDDLNRSFHCCFKR